VYEPDELGIKDLTLNAGTNVQSRHVSIEGFRHFQVSLQVTVATTILIYVAKAQLKTLTFTSRLQTTWGSAGTITGALSVYNSVYFGVNTTVLTPNNDTIGFGRTIKLRFDNTGASNTVITAWLECMS